MTTVDSFSPKPQINRIIVEINRNGEFHEYNLILSDFQKFVDRNDSRDWQLPPDPHGYDQYKEGVMTWEEYYDSPYVSRDLIEFIEMYAEKHIAEKMMASLNNILDDYKNSNYAK